MTGISCNGHSANQQYGMKCSNCSASGGSGVSGIDNIDPNTERINYLKQQIESKIIEIKSYQNLLFAAESRADSASGVVHYGKSWKKSANNENEKKDAQEHINYGKDTKKEAKKDIDSINDKIKQLQEEIKELQQQIKNLGG